LTPCLWYIIILRNLGTQEILSNAQIKKMLNF
jgi:hypothetical protein